MRTAMDIDEFPAITDPLHPVKLQILLYFTQGYYLGIYKARLIDEDVTSNQYGPCFQSVLHQYAEAFINTQPTDEILTDFKMLAELPDVSDTLNLVYDNFATMSAVDLINLAKKQSPWIDTIENQNYSIDQINQGIFIPDNKIYEFFSDLV